MHIMEERSNIGEKIQNATNFCIGCYNREFLRNRIILLKTELEDKTEKVFSQDVNLPITQP